MQSKYQSYENHGYLFILLKSQYRKQKFSSSREFKSESDPLSIRVQDRDPRPVLNVNSNPILVKVSPSVSQRVQFVLKHRPSANVNRAHFFDVPRKLKFSWRIWRKRVQRFELLRVRWKSTLFTHVYTYIYIYIYVFVSDIDILIDCWRYWAVRHSDFRVSTKIVTVLWCFALLRKSFRDISLSNIVKKIDNEWTCMSRRYDKHTEILRTISMFCCRPFERSRDLDERRRIRDRWGKMIDSRKK